MPFIERSPHSGYTLYGVVDLERSEDMSAEIVYSWNKIIHSLKEIIYKSNQSQSNGRNCLFIEQNLHVIENVSELGKDVSVQVHDESDHQSTLALLI